MAATHICKEHQRTSHSAQLGSVNRTAMLSGPANPAIFAGFIAIAFPPGFPDTSGRHFRAVFRLPLRLQT